MAASAAYLVRGLGRSPAGGFALTDGMRGGGECVADCDGSVDAIASSARANASRRKRESRAQAAITESGLTAEMEQQNQRRKQSGRAAEIEQRKQRGRAAEIEQRKQHGRSAAEMEQQRQRRKKKKLAMQRSVEEPPLASSSSTPASAPTDVPSASNTETEENKTLRKKQLESQCFPTGSQFVHGAQHQLRAYYDGTGYQLTRASEQLRQERVDASEVVAETKKVIETHVHVSDERKAYLSDRYRDKMRHEINLCACAACGVRDIEQDYSDKIPLHSLSKEFAYSDEERHELEQLPCVTLYNPQTMKAHSVHLKWLHSWYEVPKEKGYLNEGCWYKLYDNLVTETAAEGPTCRLCESCNKWNSAPPKPNTPNESDAAQRHNGKIDAPRRSIVAGCDLGSTVRLARNADPKLEASALQPTLLEAMLLADVRNYAHVVKVILPGESGPGNAARQLLQGHFISFFQDGPAKVDELILNDAKVESVLREIQVTFVDPKGRVGVLEKRCLTGIREIQVDAVRCYNLLQLRRAGAESKRKLEALPGGNKRADNAFAANMMQCYGNRPEHELGALQKALAGIPQRLMAAKHIITDDTVERKSKASDIAGVRDVEDGTKSDDADSDAGAHVGCDAAPDAHDEGGCSEGDGRFSEDDGSCSKGDQEGEGLGDCVAQGGVTERAADVMLDPLMVVSKQGNSDTALRTAFVQVRQLLLDKAGEGVADGAGDGEGDGAGEGAGDRPGDGAGDIADAGNGVAAGPRMQQVQSARAECAINEFGNNGELLYGAFWYLFPLGSGLDGMGPVSKRAARHLFLFHDNRFAADTMFLFTLANQMQRHAACRGVSARIKNSTEAFEKFEELCADRDAFVELLDMAIEDPRCKEGRTVLSKIVPVMNLGAKRVPWSSAERSSELPKLLALDRRYGPTSYFFTVAPNDVYHPTVLRLSHGSRDNNSFPAVVDADFLKALREGKVDGIQHLDIPLTNTKMQQLAAANPIATAMVVHRMLVAVFTELIGLEPSNLSTKRGNLVSRGAGIFGSCTAWGAVIELDGRKCWHWHASVKGGPTPGLLANVAGHAELESAILAAIDTHIRAEVPPAIHVLDVARRLLKAPKPHFSYHMPKHGGLDYQRWAALVASVVCFHEHKATCSKTTSKKSKGKWCCRFAKPSGHPIPKTRVCELCEKPGSDEETLSWRCSNCHMASTGQASDDAADKFRKITFSPVAPSKRLSEHDVDPRPLSYELQRRHLGTHLEGGVEVPKHVQELMTMVPKDLDEVTADTARKYIGETLRDAEVQAYYELCDPSFRAMLSELTATQADFTARIWEAEAQRPEGCRRTKNEVERLAQEKYLRKGEVAVRLCKAWAKLACRNAMVSEWSDVLCGLLGSANNPLLLGAGEASKASGMYMIKYMVKDSVALRACLSLLVDARKEVDIHPSIAEDTGSDERTAKHTLQRAINSAQMELAPTQAAAIVLGMPSSHYSDKFEWLSVWGAVKLAKILAAGELPLPSHTFARVLLRAHVPRPQVATVLRTRSWLTTTRRRSTTRLKALQVGSGSNLWRSPSGAHAARLARRMACNHSAHNHGGLTAVY